MSTGIDNSGLYSGLNQAEGRIDQFGNHISAMGDKIAKLTGIGFGVAGLKAFGNEIINVRGEMQMLESSFEVLLGGKGVSGFMSEIKQFAVDSPLSLTGVSNAAQTLLGFNIEAEKVIPTIKQLGDISMGNEQRFNSLTLAFAQMSATGKLMGQDLNQMINAGFNPLQEMSARTGKSIAELKKEMEGGAISSEMVAAAFESATAQGGKFYGMTQKQAEGIKGLQAQLDGGLQDAFNEMGKSAEGAISIGYKGAITLVENYEKVGKVILELVGTYGTYKAAVVALSVVENLRYQSTLAQMAGMTRMQAIMDVLRAKTEALNVAMAKNPYVLVGIAVAALGYGLYKLYTYQTEAEKAQSRLNDSMKEGEKASLSETRELAKLKGELSATTKGTKEYNDIRDLIVSKFGQYYQNLKTEIDTVGLLDSTYQSLTKAIQASFSARQYTKFAQAESDNLDEILSDNLGKIQDRLLDDLGDELGTKYYTTIRNALLQGQELSKDVITTLNNVQDKGTLMADSRLDQYINNIREAQKIADDIDKKARIKFGVEDDTKEPDNITVETKKIKSLAEQTDEARKAVSKLKDDLINLRSGKIESNTYADDIEKKAKELKEAEDKLSYLLTGQSASSNLKGENQAETAADKARKQAQYIADQEEKIANIKTKQTLENRRKQEDLENQLTQSYISNLSEGAEKIRYQRELDSYLEIQSLERTKEDYIQAYIQAEREKFDAAEDLKAKQNSKYLKKKFDSSSISVDTSSYDTIINNKRNSQTSVQVEAEKKAWNEYLVQFGAYQDKRKAIIEKYDREIDQVLTKGDAATLEKQKQNQLDELDNSVKNSATLMGQLFADASRKSVNEMQAIIDKAELLMQYLEAAKDEQGNAMIGGQSVSKNDILGLGISENTLNNLSLSTQEVESLRSAITKLKGELGSKSPFKLFTGQIKDAIDEIKKGNIGQGISSIGSAVSQFAPAVSQFGQDLGNIVGNDDLGSKISGIADAVGGLGQTAMGVGQIMSDDIVGGTMAAVSGISKVVDALDGLFGADYSKYNAMKEQYDKLNEVWDQLIDKKKEYLSMAYGEEAKKIGKEAEDLIKKSIDSNRTLGKEFLNSGSSAGSHSLGVRQRKDMSSEGWGQLNQWAKNNKISDSLYGSISGGRMTGLFDLTAEQLENLKEDAPTFWAKLKDDTKEYLNNIIDGAEKINEINKATKEQLTQVSFDSVFDSFVDTLMNMDSKSKDFAENFAEYLQKAILSSMVAEKYKAKLQTWYENFAQANSDGNIDTKEYADLQSEYNSIAEQAIKERDALKDMLNWSSPDSSSSSQSSSYGASTSMDQETGGLMVGRLTGIHETDLNIEGNTLKLILLASETNQIIRGQTEDFQAVMNATVQSMFYLEEIRDSVNELPEMKSLLVDIKKNTNAFKGK